jgi:hypothetical protein
MIILIAAKIWLLNQHVLHCFYLVDINLYLVRLGLNPVNGIVNYWQGLNGIQCGHMKMHLFIILNHFKANDKEKTLVE